MGATTTKLMTFAEFEKLPDEVCRRHELRHGELVEVADPKFRHLIIQRRVVQLITAVCRPDAFVTTELGFRATPEHEYRRADVGYISPERFTAAKGSDYFQGAPDMVIEILSPSNTKAEMRERAAAFAPVEGRAVENGDYVQLKLMGTPAGGGEPLQADSVLCHIGAEETMEPFNENLRGANIGDHKSFEVAYPADYPDAKLAGKTYNYAVDVLGIKNKKLPELNDEFAKDVSDAATLDELKKKVSESLEHQRDHRQKELQREKVITELVKLHEFPVPESLIEHQMDVRLERVVRSLAAQGVDPRAVNVDWVTLRKRQQERATDDVKAELIIDRIATAESIDVTEEEVDHELEHMASHSGESAEVARARLTKQGALDRMKAKLRSDKTLDWLAQNAQVKTVAVASAAAADAK